MPWAATVLSARFPNPASNEVYRLNDPTGATLICLNGRSAQPSAQRFEFVKGLYQQGP